MIKQKLIFSIIFTIILTSLTAQNEFNGFDENGERQGIWRKNYPNSYQLRYEGKFNHGKEIDTFYDEKQSNSEYPLIIQCRIFGKGLSKGTLIVDKSLPDNRIIIRKSMLKMEENKLFKDNNHIYVEVNNTSHVFNDKPANLSESMIIVHLIFIYKYW